MLDVGVCMMLVADIMQRDGRLRRVMQSGELWNNRCR
jgi:hypothetical protein